MELSLSHSSSAARALFQNSPSSPQTTTTTTTAVRLAGQFTCMSSRCSRVLPPSTTKLYAQRTGSAKLFFHQQNKSYSKVGLVLEAWKLEKANYRKEEAQSFYLFMWKLLDAEHIVLPFI